MPRVVPVDMGDRLIDRIHDFHRNNGVQILCSPVLVGGGDDLFADRAGSLVAADLHIVLLKFGGNYRKRF